MYDTLRNTIAHNKAGACIAIPSVHSAHPEVLGASLQLVVNLNPPLVIEATSNQVKQFGGYTGMDVPKFVTFINYLKSKHGIETNILEHSGDHLDPQVWKSETADMAMAEANHLVSEYVRSGIKEIHLDCSKGCADKPRLVNSYTAAKRAVDLEVTCLNAASAPEEISCASGTEVPPRDGARLRDDGHIVTTSPKSAVKTLMAHRAAFAEKGITDPWPQVSGLEVKPGIEFRPDEVFTMPNSAKSGIRDAISEYPEIYFEAHSTDFQPPAKFSKFVNISFAFQKVGPALTFASQRALYALDHTVQKRTPSAIALPQVVKTAMRENPENWKSHYSENDISKRQLSYADRIRYYWSLPAINEVVDNLILTFDKLKISKHILEQSFSSGVLKRSEGLVASREREIVRSKVQGVLFPYFSEKRDA